MILGVIAGEKKNFVGVRGRPVKRGLATMRKEVAKGKKRGKGFPATENRSVSGKGCDSGEGQPAAKGTFSP